LKIDKDKRETITVTTEPTAIPPEQITWTTTDENIAVYENGEIVGKEVGKCVIRAQSGTDAERVYDEVYVDVVISVKGIVTLKESYEIPVNETFDFAKEVTINPANATNQKLEWSVVSGGETIIEINATGKALAKSVGEAKIRVKALDGSGVDREIPVKVIEVNATSIEVEPQEIALKAGSSATLRAKFTPSNTTNKNVTWTIADSEYATIDEHTGEVTALEAGERKVTTITATSEDGGHTSKCRLRILPKEIILPKTLKLSPNQMTMNVRDELPITVTISPSNAQEQESSGMYLTQILWKSAMVRL
jgi:candidate alpha glycosidase; glycoside hydrolase family 13